MVNAGELTELTNADKVELTNSTDSLDFGQLHDIRWSSRMPTHKRTRTDKKRNVYVGLPEITIEGDLWVTTPEITTLVSYHTLSNGDLPVKNWDLKTTAFDASTDTIRIAAKETGLDFVGPEQGLAVFHIVLTTTTGVITEP